MKKLLTFFIITLLSFNAIAGTETKAPKDILVKISLDLTDKKDGLAQQRQSQTKLVMNTNTNQWQTVEKLLSCSGFFILSGKIENPNQETASLHFLLLNSSTKSDVIFEPKIIARFNQPSTLQYTNTEMKDAARSGTT
ncbi:MAG: hypothetical protein P4M14_06435 [Gammaproteobacteria bacterium]|nr:hypothetical protein [Gammaproteobacteria bacterium]